jgi:hypothetical protein
MSRRSPNAESHVSAKRSRAQFSVHMGIPRHVCRQCGHAIGKFDQPGHEARERDVVEPGMVKRDEQLALAGRDLGTEHRS